MLMPSPSPHPELLSCFVCLIRLWLLITHAVCVPIKKMYVQMDRVKRNKNKNKSISGAKYVECSKKKNHWKIHYGQHSKIKFVIILILLAKTCDTMCVILSFVVYTLIYVHSYVYIYMRASQVALVVKNPLANAGRCKRRGFHPWVRKIPWRRKWQPTTVFWPGESHGQRSLAGCSP